MPDEPDFRTPLKIHRSAFERMAPGLRMPAQALEALRKAFQAGERSGDPKTEWRYVADAVAETNWTWPWMEECAEQFSTTGAWPLTWAQERIFPPLHWADVPHGPRVRLLLAALRAAVQTEQVLDRFRSLQKGGIREPVLELLGHDDRCTATVRAIATAILIERAGKPLPLPPFFPGDRVTIRIRLDRR